MHAPPLPPFLISFHTSLCLLQFLSEIQLVYKCLCIAWLVTVIPNGETTQTEGVQHSMERRNDLVGRGLGKLPLTPVERGSAHLEAPKSVCDVCVLFSGGFLPALLF